ncbi:MAG TPA: hypothetical protein VNO43_14820 [Candidatus Eisenbacteria bacterium]|nr:hypothetical protein [Candidatus Eisenbacteria bacterium]
MKLRSWRKTVIEMRIDEKTNREAEVAFGSEDRIDALFQPDTLSHDQYFDNIRKKLVLEPEKSLMLAVLEDGIRTFQDNVLAKDAKKRALFEEARDWLWSDDSSWPFSFVSLCAFLGLDPGYIRRGLTAWREKRLADWQKKQAKLPTAKRKAA